MDKKLQAIACALGIIGSLWLGAWAFADKVATTTELRRLEAMTIATFKSLQESMDIKFLQQQLTILQDRKYKIREEMRKAPGDEVLKQDYDKVNKDILEIEKQLINLNIKKNQSGG